jgi:hypothetical protein
MRRPVWQHLLLALGVGWFVVAMALPAWAAGGTKIWLTRYDGPQSLDDSAVAVAASPDSSVVFVTGSENLSENGNPSDIRTIAYDALTGDMIWSTSYDGPANGFDVGADIAVGPAGDRVFVTGRSEASQYDYDVVTLAYDAATGAQLWVKRYAGPAVTDGGNAIAISPDGTLVAVTGVSEGGATGDDIATLAYDAVTGAQQWVARFDRGNDDGYDVAFSPNSAKIFVTGTAKHDYVTVAYKAATGEKLWSKRYDGPADFYDYDVAVSLVVSPDGTRVFVTGESYGKGDYNADWATVAYAAGTGAQKWVARYDSTDGEDYAHDIAISPDGKSLFVTGSTDCADIAGLNCGLNNLETISYKASTGATRWASEYHNDFYDVGLAVVVNPEGTTAYVTGFTGSEADTGYSYATLAYNSSSGDMRWTQLYDTGHDTQAADIAMSPNGSAVFVTGQSDGKGTGKDFATIAYEA